MIVINTTAAAQTVRCTAAAIGARILGVFRFIRNLLAVLAIIGMFVFGSLAANEIVTGDWHWNCTATLGTINAVDCQAPNVNLDFHVHL